MDPESPRCPGCDADLGARRHCLECDIELMEAPDEPSHWLARLRGVLTQTPEPDAAALQLELANGKKIELQLGGTRWVPDDRQLRAGDAVDLLAVRLLVFDQGGLREAPRQQDRLVARVVSSGLDAATLLDEVLEDRLDRQPAPDKERQLPWPEGFSVDPRPGPHGWRLRLHLGGKRGFPLGLIAPLVLVAFYGLWIWIFKSTARPLLLYALGALVLIAILVLLLRRRTVVLDARHLALQRGPLPWLRRRVARTDDITSVYPGHEDSGFFVAVQTQSSGREQLVWGLEYGPTPLLVASLLESALGLRSQPTEVLSEFQDRLPDMERLLRPMRGERDPLEELGIRSEYLDQPDERVDVVERSKERVELRVRASGIGNWTFYVLVPGALWLLFSRSLLFTRPMPFLVIDGLGCALAVVGGYGVLAQLINRARLVLTPGALRIRRGPLPWPGSRSFSRALISHLETDANHVGKGVWVYGLDMILRDGRRVRLFRAVPSQDLVEWLERAVTRVMRLGRG
jgi:hypothetical protein